MNKKGIKTKTFTELMEINPLVGLERPENSCEATKALYKIWAFKADTHTFQICIHEN